MIKPKGRSRYTPVTAILLFLAVFFAGIIFLADINTPPELAIGVMYCVVILYSWLLPGQLSSIWIAILCTVLVLIDFSYSDNTSTGSHISGINRIISMVAIWVSASLVTIAKRSFKELELAKEDLEIKVFERTQDLRASESRFRHMIGQVKDYSIVLLDTQGTITNWNQGAEAIKGYTAEEVIGKNFRLFYTRSGQKIGKPEMLLKIASRDGSAMEEGWRLRKDGSKFWGSISITAIYDDFGNISGFSKVTRDLTERKKAEEAQFKFIQRLRRKNKELEQFAYVASHDLQEPLRTLSSYSELFEEQYRDQLDEEANTYLNFISEASERMRQLVKALLDYNRIGSKKTLATVDCNELVAEVVNDLSASILEAKAKVTVDKLPQILGYKTELRLLFQNLIANALKFRKKDRKTTVHIKGRKSKDGWQFSIRDNGIGIAGEYKEQIFVIFKRLHNRRDYEGTGIGLAHCQKIVDLHGGRIWVDSEPDQGSTFYFTIETSQA